MTQRNPFLSSLPLWRRLAFFTALVVIMVCMGVAVLELMKLIERSRVTPVPEPPRPSSIATAPVKSSPEEAAYEPQTPEQAAPKKPVPEKAAPEEQSLKEPAPALPPSRTTSPRELPSGPVFQKLSERFIPLFEDDLSFQGLSAAIDGSIGYYEKFPRDQVFYFGADPMSAAHLIRSLEMFRDFIRENMNNASSPIVLREFVLAHYDIYAYLGGGNPHEVLFTGYYEPLLSGSRERTPAFRHPVYGRPVDLVVLDDPGVSLGAYGKTDVGRRSGEFMIPYYTRREISKTAVEAFPAPVIAWVDDPVALFFLQIQGSGKIRFKEGETLNVHYLISNGHPYKSIGKTLIDTGKLDKEAISMQSIRKYLEDHPDEQEAVFNTNPRYVFFETTEKEPVGCYGIELIPGRALALDRNAFPAGALAFVQTEKPVVDQTGEIIGWTKFSRFFTNQDTGSAIKGPGRADIFWGNGLYAELAAGYLKHPGRLFFLTLKPGML